MTGRNLDYIKDGNTFVANYAYNADGVRHEKVVDNIKTEYIYTNGQLSAMKVGDDMLYFTYDSNGVLVSVKYNDTIYYYLLNPQGDVVGLCNENGATVATYKYNEWGKHITQPTSGIGALNPFRYRGYIYDAETGFYRTDTRYYDPEVGRFISADKYISTGTGMLGYNMFTYCNNNPIMRSDPSGEFPWWAIIVIGCFAVIGGIIGGTSDVKLYNDDIYIYKSNEETNDVAPQNNTGPVFTMANDALVQNENEELTTKDRVVNTIIGASMGAAAGGLVIATAGAAVAVFANSAAVAGILGGTGIQISALGALVYDVVAITVGPFLGIEMEPLEYAP